MDKNRTTLTATRLRQNLYAVLDEALETGNAVEVDRKGRILRIVPEPRGGRLSRLVPHDLIIGDPQDLVHVDWSATWSEDRDT